jgi:hypothetical protein
MVQSYLINSDAAHLVADMVGRCRAVTQTDITQDLTAAVIMLNSNSNLPTGDSAFVLAINFDATSGAASVAWSQSMGSAPAPTATVLSHVSASNMGSPGGSVIVVGINDGTSTSYGYAVPRLTAQIPMLNTPSTSCNQ